MTDADKAGTGMALQRTMYQKQNISLISAPWTMHEFFAGSGLVAYGLKEMFAPVWANDISEQKAAVYEANRNSTLSDIITQYNRIVLDTETDPSLRIEFDAR